MTRWKVSVRGNVSARERRTALGEGRRGEAKGRDLASSQLGYEKSIEMVTGVDLREGNEGVGDVDIEMRLNDGDRASQSMLSQCVSRSQC